MTFKMKDQENFNSEIWISGMGIVSAAGNNLDECLHSLVNDQAGIDKITLLETIHKDNYVAGEVKLTNKEIASVVKDSPDLPRTTLLALLAAGEALNSAGYKPGKGTRAGLVLGTTVGGMDKTERFFMKDDDPKKYIFSHHCGYTTAYLAQKYGFKHYANTISTACSSGANAVMLGAKLIKHGLLDVVLAGGTDALSIFTLNGFRSLMILDHEPCKPFSNDRKGLNLGEGAGFVFLESKGHAIQRQAKGICRISGYGNSNDAFHQTASSPDGRGAYKAMEEAINVAGIAVADIDYINVHGTGTDNNDLTEAIAIQRLFNNHVPDFSSTKTFTGHCLGAAGAIEAIFSAAAIRRGEVYSNLRFTSPVGDTGLIPVLKFKKKRVRHVLSNSFGFGGCDTSLLLSEITG
jgi:3-oxoacyl-(acyl-carrier-protein) synthase